MILRLLFGDISYPGPWFSAVAVGRTPSFSSRRGGNDDCWWSGVVTDWANGSFRRKITTDQKAVTHQSSMLYSVCICLGPFQADHSVVSGFSYLSRMTARLSGSSAFLQDWMSSDVMAGESIAWLLPEWRIQRLLPVRFTIYDLRFSVWFTDQSIIHVMARPSCASFPSR